MILKEEEDSVVDYHRLSDQPKPSKGKQSKTMFDDGPDSKFHSWNFKENYAYITYLRNYKFVFDSAYARKRIKVFSHLSKLLKTRNPFQVKSHHQKMMISHNSVDNIIDYHKLKILKFLRASPSSLEDIERINQQCRIFFIEQASFVNEQNLKCEQQARQTSEAQKGYKRRRQIKEENMRKIKADGINEEEMKNKSSLCKTGEAQCINKI